jgi:hypothetical protein
MGAHLRWLSSQRRRDRAASLAAIDAVAHPVPHGIGMRDGYAALAHAL